MKKLSLRKFIAFFTLLIFTISIFNFSFFEKAKAQDTVKIVGNWADAGSWNFNNSTIVLNESITPGLYYGEYTFTTAGTYEFKAMINGSTWCTGAPKVGGDNTNIPITVSNNQTVKFWFFKNSQLVIDSIHFPNGPADFTGTHAIKFVGLNNEWNPDDGKYQFSPVLNAAYTYIFDNTNNDNTGNEFKIVVGGFGNLSWAWNASGDNGVINFKDGGGNVNIPALKENGNLLKTKFYLDLLHGWLFTDKDLEVVPTNFTNNGTVFNGANLQISAPFNTPNANQITKTIEYEVLDNQGNILVNRTAYTGGILVDNSWIDKNIVVNIITTIGSIQKVTTYNLTVKNIPTDILVQALDNCIYSTDVNSLVTFANGESKDSVRNNFTVVTNQVYSFIYDGQNINLNISLNWQSNNTNVININGSNASVTRPDNDTTVTLNVYAQYGQILSTNSKNIDINVIKKSNILGVEGGIPVTFKVTLPQNTPLNSDVYIAGDFGTNKLPTWNPSGIKLNNIGDYTREITLYLTSGTTIQYKYTRGDWGKVEKSSTGAEIANRTLKVGNSATTQNDTIASFADLGPTSPSVTFVKPNPVTVLLNGQKSIVYGDIVKLFPSEKENKITIDTTTVSKIDNDKSNKVVVFNKISENQTPAVTIEKKAIELLNNKDVKQLELQIGKTTVTIDTYKLQSDKDISMSLNYDANLKNLESKYILKGLDVKVTKKLNIDIRADNQTIDLNGIYISTDIPSDAIDNVVYYLDNGNLIPVKDFIKQENKIIFRANKSGQYVIAKIQKQFNDYDIDSNQEDIFTLIQLGIITGDAQNNINLDSNIKRSELAALIARAYNLSPITFQGYFKDVEPNAWYRGYVEALKNASILDGYNGNFKPNDNITKEQLAKIIVQMAKHLNIDLDKSDATINDIDKVSNWAKEYVKLAVSEGLIKLSDNNINPTSYATRYEVFNAIYNLLQKKNSTLESYIGSDVKLVPGDPTGIPVEFIVKVPQNTPDNEKIIIAGTFANLGYTDWNPGDSELALTKIDNQTYSITIYMKEGTQIQYKYVRGDWSKVEKDKNGNEISNRVITVKNDGSGKMTINDEVQKWADK
ncbi:S-layer homology domain-containing protein [Caldicellulosiruptoraceae bacterium PP1]